MHECRESQFVIAAKHWKLIKTIELRASETINIILPTSTSITIDGDHHYGVTIHYLSAKELI